MAFRINLKTIDYYKFRKMVIDGNRDDYGVCSKEVKSLCDCVQTISFRDEEFDDESDRIRFDQICSHYKEILQNKRIDPADMRIKSGWWGDHRNAYSAGKLKASVLRGTFISKATEWVNKHANDFLLEEDVPTKIDGPGLYVFKHKEHQCFQFVGRSERVFASCGERLKAAFEGNIHEPLAALLLICMASDWDFYFIPVEATDGDGFLRVLENDLIMKHDSIWPHGLNFRLHIDTLFEVSEFRRSCIRHQWPPQEDTVVGDTIDFVQVRKAYAEFRNFSGTELAVDEPPKRRPRTPASSAAPRDSASSPATNEISVAAKTSRSLPRKTSAATAAVTTPRSEQSHIQRSTSARKQRSTPTPRQPMSPRGKTKSVETKYNQRSLRRTPAPQTPKPKDVTPLASPPPSPPPSQSPSSSSPTSPPPSLSPSLSIITDADASPHSPLVQELGALPFDTGRRRNSSSSSRGTWTIDDGSASPRSFSPERSPPSSPAKASPKSPSRIPTK